MGESEQVTVSAILYQLLDMIEQLDNRLKVLERPGCDHEWGEPSTDVGTMRSVVCVKCGQRRYV